MEDEGKEWRRRAAAVEEHAKARKRAEEAAAAVAKERGAAAAALQKEMTLDVPTHPTHSGLKPQLVISFLHAANILREVNVAKCYFLRRRNTRRPKPSPIRRSV